MTTTHGQTNGTSTSTQERQAMQMQVARLWSEQLWGGGDLAVADDIIAADYVRHDPGDPFAARGPADVKRIVTMLRSMLPDLRLDVEDMIVQGDRVVTRYTGTATDTHGYMGRPATGKTIRTTGIQIFRFDGDGKIAESWAVRDDLGTLVQLGHVPPRPAPASPPPPMQLGHVHLRVADLPRATAFYRDVLGFAVTADLSARGIPLVLLAAGDYHHHIALNTFRSAGGSPPPAGHTGLHHVALLYPDRAALGRAVARVLAGGVTVDGAQDHGATVSVYLHDPDGNGLELYYDRPRETWADADGNPPVQANSFDVHDLVREVQAIV